MAMMDWRGAALAQLKDRDQREKVPFETIINSHVALWNTNQLLMKQRERLRAATSINPSASTSSSISHHVDQTTSASTSSGHSTEKSRELERKIEVLQAELTASYKKEAKEATSQLALEAELRQLQSNEQAMKAAVERLRIKLKETQALLEEEQRSGGRAREEATTLRDELLRVRRLLEIAENKNRQLTKDNADLVNRILTEKLKVADELNQMTQLCEELQAKLKTKESEDAQKKTDDGEQATAKAKEEDDGTVSLSKDVESQVKGGVKRDQTGILGIDVTGGPSSFGTGAATEGEDTDMELWPSTPLRFQAHDSEIPTIRFDETGFKLFTCSCDGTIKVWYPDGGTCLKTLRSPVDVQLMGMDVKDKFVVGTGSDRTVRIWSLESERVVHTLTGHASKVYACRLTPDAKTAVSGGTDRKVMSWDVATGNRVRMISCSSIINAVSVSEEGNYIATGHQDTSVRMWDLRSGKMALAVTDCHSNTVTSVEFTRSGKILTNSRDNTLGFIDLVAGKTVSRFSDSRYKVAYNWSSADASPSGKIVAGGSGDGSIFFWLVKEDISATKAKTVLMHGDKRVAAFAFSPDGGGKCASADESGSVVVWSAKRT